MCGPATLTSYARGSTDERHLTLFVFVSRGSPLTCLSLCISLSLCLSRPPYPVACLTRLSHSSLSLSLRIRCLDTYRHDHPSLFSLYLSLYFYLVVLWGGEILCSNYKLLFIALPCRGCDLDRRAESAHARLGVRLHGSRCWRCART